MTKIICMKCGSKEDDNFCQCSICGDFLDSIEQNDERERERMKRTKTNHWTQNEIKAFTDWDQKRKEGKLGVPMHFNTVDELMNWLYGKKDLVKK